MSYLISLQDCYEERLEEGGAMRRAKRDAFIRQLMPPLAPASVHSGGTGHPYAVMIASRVTTHVKPKKKKSTRKPKAKKGKAKRKNKR
jgi:hypothetical protein